MPRLASAVAVGIASFPHFSFILSEDGKDSAMEDAKRPQERKSRFSVTRLEPRIAPAQSHFPPGQFPAGNPGHAPGQSNVPGNSGK